MRPTATYVRSVVSFLGGYLYASAQRGTSPCFRVPRAERSCPLLQQRRQSGTRTCRASLPISRIFSITVSMSPVRQLKRRHRKAKLVQTLQCVRVRRDGLTLDDLNVKDKNIQRALRRNLRVFLSKRPRRRVGGFLNGFSSKAPAARTAAKSFRPTYIPRRAPQKRQRLFERLRYGFDRTDIQRLLPAMPRRRA